MEAKANIERSGRSSPTTPEVINANQPDGQKWKLSTWIKAIKAGNTVPGSEKANKMLKDLHEKCTREQIAAFKVGLDWNPLILGDG
eukprot:2107051-Karenia_brevis.AAC.1